MYKNAIFLILLLSSLYFSISSCDLFQPLSSVQINETERPPNRPKPVTSTKKPPADHTEVSSLRQEVVDYARQFVGTGYQYAGKNPNGFDCSGFTGYVFKQFDISLSGSSRYQENDGVRIPVSEVQPGDLLFFRKEKNGAVFHVSLVISNDADGLYVVHSTSSRGVVIDNIRTNSYWKEKYVTACRVIQP